MKYARVIIAPSAVRWSLAALLPSNDPILMTQHFLREAHGQREAIHGGGISVMSSMHLGACTLLAILAWRSFWRIPAIMLWLVIWVGAVHFGDHYADGIIAAALTVICWRITAPRETFQAIPFGEPELSNV